MTWIAIKEIVKALEQSPPPLAATFTTTPEHKPHKYRMSSFDASTPQLKAAKRWMDAYSSLDTKNIAAATSKNYQYQVLPEVIGIPEEAKERHLERYRDIFGAMAKAEVCIQWGELPSSHTDIHRP